MRGNPAEKDRNRETKNCKANSEGSNGHGKRNVYDGLGMVKPEKSYEEEDYGLQMKGLYVDEWNHCETKRDRLEGRPTLGKEVQQGLGRSGYTMLWGLWEDGWVWAEELKQDCG
ncbi:unnamed protein product [Blepharisma stoltei]|uniref:Uncharacterized protein n=1 Tax=Blepharisma stoltei TaxID=1481888 RepID=A0AAU9J4V2_9CILI|nr:unnamed protein product [Blepharisma stoltei]